MDKPKQEQNDKEMAGINSQGSARWSVWRKYGIGAIVVTLVLLISLPLSAALQREIAPPDGLEIRTAEDKTVEGENTGNQVESVVYTPEEQARLEQRQAQREAAARLAEQKREEEERAAQEAARAAQEAMLAAQSEVWSPEGSTSTVEGAFGALFEQIFAPQGDTYECRYNAKGNLYMVLSPGTVLLEGETEERDTVRTLVFDRESKNGECWLIVYYEEILNADGSEYTTAIRNTYAIKKDGGEVIPSGKKAWADVGSAEYQEAAGEK